MYCPYLQSYNLRVKAYSISFDSDAMLKGSESVLLLPATLTAVKIDTPPIIKMQEINDDVIMVFESGCVEIVQQSNFSVSFLISFRWMLIAITQ